MRQQFTPRTAGVLVLIVAGLVTAVAASPSPFVVSMTGVTDEGVSAPLALQRADYEIHVFGSTAMGVLVQEFTNVGEQDLEAIYDLSSEVSLRPEELHVERDGFTQRLGYSMEEPPPAAPRQANAQPTARLSQLRGARQAKNKPKATPSQLESDAVTVESEQSVWIRTTFRAELGVSQGTFLLSLPTVQGETAGPVAGNVSVQIHHAEPLVDARSPSHEVLVVYEGDRTIVELVRQDSLGDGPFELTFSTVSEEDANFSSYVGREVEGRRQISATFTPPSAPVNESVRPKQVLFIVDTSGSMAQGKLVQAREALVSCLEKLRSGDSFNIVEFDSNFSMLAEQPLETSDLSLEQAGKWLGNLQAHGSTILLPALDATFLQPADEQRHRMIIVITDGRLGDEAQVLELMEQKLDDSRLFVVGIGNNPNRNAILRLAEYGRGAATFAADNELQGAVIELFDAISQPLAWDLAFDWDGAEVEEMSPSRLPDLYADRPVKVMAWVRGEVPSELRLRVTTMEGQRHYRVQLPPRDLADIP